MQAVRLTASARRSIELTSMMAAQLTGEGSIRGNPMYDRGCIVTVLKVNQGTCLVAHDCVTLEFQLCRCDEGRKNIHHSINTITVSYKLT